MRALILVAALPAVLTACAAPGPNMARGDTKYSNPNPKPNPYRSETGSPSDWSRPYYGDRYWPPVDPNSAFPPQIMDGGSKGK